MGKGITILVWISLLIESCTVTPEVEQAPTLPPEVKITVIPSVVPNVQLPESDQILFTIPNPELFSGREGEARPDWLGWGAETLVVAPDGSFWIADTAVSPNRLLHYSPQGELLAERSLANLVVYAYDLAVTQDHLWVLDVSSQPPKIVQLGPAGEFQANIDIPEQSMTQDNILVYNGILDLSVGEEGQLWLQGINGNYEMVDASGSIHVRPLDTLEYYGHTYRTGIYDESANYLPILVDGEDLNISSEDFFVEMPFLGFNPDGSFAVAGWVDEGAEYQGNRQVRYYSHSGQLLGLARLRPSAFYKDWNHSLAFGPDGAVYQLLSNVDHSVQVLRLGFSDELPRLAQPMLTPTPLTALQPSESAVTDEEQARNALLAFFTELSSGNYEQAAAYYGGEKIEYAREREPNETAGEYWEYICSTILWCIPVTEITETEQVSESEFTFHVVFMTPDGRRFEVGACCGGDPAASPGIWQFKYPVKKMDGIWKVTRGPIFTP